MSQQTPKGFRLHIGLFGRRNVGKSSLLNALTKQQVSIVSEVAGTTTDPVEKPMELLPLGPVLFIDTAGVDDEGALGTQRVAGTKKVFDRTDLAVVVAEDGQWGAFEDRLAEEFERRKIPVLRVFNKCDGRCDGEGLRVSALTGEGIEKLRAALLEVAPADWIEVRPIAADLVGPGETAVLVIPIDKEAPRGRIILPQVQVIRDLLDHDSMCMVVKETGLKAALADLKRPPKLVVTDSQAFARVSADTPEDIPLTSFSILMARLKGDLAAMAEGAETIDDLRPGDPVLIAESCSHHPIEEDIGRVKIPNWLRKKVGGELEFAWTRGHDFPDDLARYKLVIHCGGCMWNRREILSRIMRCHEVGVPITNYGLCIAFSLGIFERALCPFGLKATVET